MTSTTSTSASSTSSPTGGANLYGQVSIELYLTSSLYLYLNNVEDKDGVFALRRFLPTLMTGQERSYVVQFGDMYCTQS